MTATVSIIVAHDDNLGIGKGNQLLWRISKDLQRFKKLTMGHPVIMGRKTFESIGKALPGRTNIIVTRNLNLITTPEWQSVSSLDQAIKLAKSLDNQEIFIIGGGEIYKQSLPLTDKLYVTHVKGNFSANVFFPDYFSDFISTKQTPIIQEGEYKYFYLTLIRVK